MSVDLFKCPVEGCTYAIGAAGPVDPDDPTEFEDEVREHQRSHDDDGRVHDVAEAEALAYAAEAEWPPVAPDPYAVDYARALIDPEPEGEPADIGEDDGQAPRPFQVGDEVLIDGEPGVIVEMRDGPGWIPSTYTLVQMTGFPFPAWDAVRLTPDRTREARGRQIELVRPAPSSRFAPPSDAPPAMGGRIPDTIGGAS